MKLHWKILIISVAFVFVAVASVSTALLQYSFSNAVERARQNAVSSHSYFEATLVNRAGYERLYLNLPALTDTAVKDAVDEVCSAGDSADNGTGTVYVVVRADDFLYRRGDGNGIIETGAFPDDAETGKCYTGIYEKEGKNLLTAFSVITVDRYNFRLYTLYDISDIYSENDNSFRASVIISICTSVIISVLLFGVTLVLLRPLKRVYSALDLVADGNYSVRLPEKGCPEIKRMSENVNTMASAVGKNVQRLEEIAEGRKQYIDRLAHEMKTPLTSILGFGDLLRIRRKVPDSERMEYAATIVDEAKRMKNMSSKLLEIAVAESGEIEKVETEIIPFLTDCISVMSPAFENSGVSLIFDESSENGTILCDRELFKSLIYNLIDNARKASEEGQTVTVSAAKTKDKMQIFVRDEGIGMTKEVLKRVTEPFYMADKKRSRKEGGAGIGLSLCVEIAKRHGATLSAKSTPGKGTVMTVTVPRAEDSKKESDRQ